MMSDYRPGLPTYHRGKTLYDHDEQRYLLFAALMTTSPYPAWRHSTVDVMDDLDFFLAGIDAPDGPLTCWLPRSMWNWLPTRIEHRDEVANVDQYTDPFVDAELLREFIAA
jgi:hypothetical protein